MSVKKYHVPYNVNKSGFYDSLLKENFLHTRKLKSVIKSICSKDSFDRDQLIKKLPLKSLEGFYLSRVFDSSDRDHPHGYCVRRNMKLDAVTRTHELEYFKGKEKPHLILEIES